MSTEVPIVGTPRGRTMAQADDSEVVGPSKPRLLRVLGPGLITGASDDDPSGIGTYSQAGAQLGFGIGWTMLLTYPLMTAIQEISARVGRTTGHGIAGVMARHYPNWSLQLIVAVLFGANAVNIGADLGAMADALSLVIGGPVFAYVLLFGTFSVLAQVFLHYARYAKFLQFLTLSLLAYLATLAVVEIPWGEAAKGLLVPKVSWSREYLTTLVAILGTTISPYLFFWQASEEAEDIRSKPRRRALLRAPDQAPGALARIRADTLIGMAVSNLIAISIILTTAATLHANGDQTIETAAQAAEALRPIAGRMAELLFAIGIIGTGLLAIPVLAGAAAYAVGEARRWPVGLSRQPREARAFYLTIAAATAIGIGINLTPIKPMEALYWSAVANGVIAVPVMVMLMLITSRSAVMGKFAIKGPLRVMGWLATAVMAVAVAGMGVALF